MGEGVGRCLHSQRVADLELPVVVVDIGRVEIVVRDGFLLQVPQRVDEGLGQKDSLRLREVHGRIVPGLYDLGEGLPGAFVVAIR